MLLAMVKTTLVFIPDTLQTNKVGYLEGLYKKYEECEAFYVTNWTPIEDPSRTVGYTGDLSKSNPSHNKTIHVDSSTGNVTRLSGQGDSLKLVKIQYDFHAFRSCERLTSETQYGTHFKDLCENLRQHQSVDNARRSSGIKFLEIMVLIINVFINVLDRSKLVWGFSATLTHFRDTVNSYRWFLSELIRERSVSPKTGNFILTKLLDVTIGVILLQFFVANQSSCLSFVEQTRETIIHNFRDLLVYLMGSPIGLKLNYVFNNTLGVFFFYHISLWRIFLMTMQPFITHYFQWLVLPGAMGFSFQVAMLSDLVSVGTFHVYCIYVYAARLIYFQLKALLSLWRLFIGRKYNPLRDKVDSHEYSHHQLFIGTLGFTVLLFLLPTTTMYYAVFVIFRMIIMIMAEILTKIRHCFHGLPLYVLLLWGFKSPQMTGRISLHPQTYKDGGIFFEAHLNMLPLNSCIRKFAPRAHKTSTNFSWKKIFTGVLL